MYPSAETSESFEVLLKGTENGSNQCENYSVKEVLQKLPVHSPLITPGC